MLLRPSEALNRFHLPVGALGPTQSGRDEIIRYGYRVGSFNILIPEKILSELVDLQTHIHPVPVAPSWLRGLISLRGNLVPVFDLLQALFVDQVTSMNKATKILVLDKNERAIGILCEGHAQSVKLTTTSCAPPSTLPAAIIPFVGQAWQEKSGMWLELNLHAFFKHLGEKYIHVAPMPT